MSTLRYWAAVKAEAGLAEEAFVATDLAELLAAAQDGKTDRFVTVLSRCSYVVDGHPVGGREHASIALTAASVVDALPPFAGG